MKKLVLLLLSVALLASNVSAFFAGRYIAPILAARDMLDRIIIEAAKEKPPEEEPVERGHVAYVVSARQCLNLKTEKYYAELTLINETGRFEVTTVEDVENYNFMPVFTEDYIGKLSAWEGKLIIFDMKKNDKIQKLETRRSDILPAFDGDDGFYRVNVAGERNGIISFYNTDKAINDVQNTSPIMLACREDSYAVIAIEGGEYGGTRLNKISSKAESLPAGGGNAVIQVEDGEIVRVFSFSE